MKRDRQSVNDRHTQILSLLRERKELKVDELAQIFGVSLDETAGPWKAAIKRNNMNWHHVSSLKGWDCPVAKQYNVTGIPRMYIIDPEGKIIAQDLRGEELANFVAGLYE